MIPPGKTTLFRMQLAAQNEAERIEISQDGRVREKLLAEPMPSQVALRDDFAGIVRLIEIIMSDRVMLERFEERSRARRAGDEQGLAPVADRDEAALRAGDEEVAP